MLEHRVLSMTTGDYGRRIASAIIARVERGPVELRRKNIFKVRSVEKALESLEKQPTVIISSPSDNGLRATDAIPPQVHEYLGTIKAYREEQATQGHVVPFLLIPHYHVGPRDHGRLEQNVGELVHLYEPDIIIPEIGLAGSSEFTTTIMGKIMKCFSNPAEYKNDPKMVTQVHRSQQEMTGIPGLPGKPNGYGMGKRSLLRVIMVDAKPYLNID